jgi:hypothetical protein
MNYKVVETSPEFLQEHKELLHLKEVVYRILNEYEIYEIAPEVGVDQDMACISLRSMLKLSRAYEAIGFHHDDC